jgi:Flp pilus assembly protein protease CpaA
MISLILFLVFILSALGIGVLAGLSDLRGLIIPNIYSILIAAAFPLCYALMWLLGDASVFKPLWSHLGALVLVLIVSAAMFHFRVMGAADSKLASAYALWLGLGALPVFLFVMSLVGAVLGVAALYIRKNKPFKEPKPESWVGQLQSGKNKVPYGIAIVCGAVYGFYAAGYLDFTNLAAVFDV